MFRIVSLTVVLTLIVILGITFFKVVAPFLMPLFVAGMVAILAQPLFLYFVRRTNGRVRLASGLATATVVFAIMTPLVVGTAIASVQMFVFATDSEKWDRFFDSGSADAGQRTDAVARWIADQINGFRGIPDSDERGEPATTVDDAGDTGVPIRATQSDVQSTSVEPVAGSDPGLPDIPKPDGVDAESNASSPVDRTSNAGGETSILTVGDAAVLDEAVSKAIRESRRLTAEQIKSLARAKVQELLINLGGRSLGIVTGVVFSIISGIVALLIFTVALYYFFADGTELLAATEKLIPVHVDYQREMLNEFARAVRGVVSATFLAALGQALATTVALWLCGFDHLLVLFVLCLLSAMIPALGTWLVWGPCAILLVVSQPSHPVSATLLALYGAIVVGLLDNVIRTYVLNSDIKLHPLLALISVLGGLQVMGLWGIFIGPIVASCLYALVRIFNLELKELSRSRFGDQAVAAAESMIAVAGVDGERAAGNTSPAVDNAVVRTAREIAPAPEEATTQREPPRKPKETAKGRKGSRRRR